MHTLFYRQRDLTGTAKTRREGSERGILPYSPALLWRKVKAGTFPPPIRLSEGVSAFPTDEVDTVVTALKAGATEDDLRRLVSQLIAKRREASPA